MATDVLLEDQVTDLSSASAGVTVAVRVCVLPTVNEMDELSRLTPVTRGFTVTAQLAVATGSVAAHAPDEGGVGAQSGIEYLVVVHSENTIPLWMAKSDSR